MHPVSRRIATTLLALSCLSAFAQDQAVQPKEIQEHWTGKTLVGTAANRDPVTMQLLADGVATLTAGKVNDRGSWRVSDKGYCTTWRKIRAGQERCFTVRRSGDKLTVLNPDGTVSGTFDDIQ